MHAFKQCMYECTYVYQHLSQYLVESWDDHQQTRHKYAGRDHIWPLHVLNLMQQGTHKYSFGKYYLLKL